MTSQATTVVDYLQELPQDRRESISKVREVVLANLPEGVEEGMQYGMIGYFIPHSLYPKGYHCDPKQPLPFASLANQKNHMALYLFCVYMQPERAEEFRQNYLATGKKLDMGASCVRFKRAEDLPIDLIASTIRAFDVDSFIARYEAVLATRRK